MIKKSFMILMIFLVLIASINAISASDADEVLADVDLVEQTLEISTDDGILSDNINNEITGANDETALSDGDPGNFTELNTLITENDEISLEKSYRYISSDSALQTGIPITKNVTIIGNGFTIDSTDAAQLFTVNADCKLILKDVTLLTDYVLTSSATSKGNILNKGEIIFDNVTFTSKRISSGNAIAAAIFSDTTGKITIKNSDFVDSISNYTGTSTTMPYGLIYNKGILNIENSLFKNNGVYSTGSSMSTQNGLIYNYKTMTMENTTFENNFITYKGEGMCLINGIIFGAASTTNLFNNCTFKENIVESHAAKGSYLAYGTICIKGGAPVVTNSKFIKNSAWTGAAIAILPTTGSVTLKSENNTFIENSANYDGSIALGGSGGAIYIHHNSILDSKNDKFINNSAVYGGAIYGRTYNTNMANITVTNAIIEGNTATAGSAIYRTNKTTANNNYWGTNNPDFEQLITDGTVSLTPDNYVLMKIEGESSLSQGAVETYTVNFKTNDTDEIAALPEYTVDLTATNELSDENVTIKDGSASFTYTAASAGDDVIIASADSQEKARFEVAVEGAQSIEGTFTELSNFIRDTEGELDLERDYTFDANIDAGLENGIVINKTITINGHGFKINSTELAKLFNVESTGNLILKDVIILNDYASTGPFTLRMQSGFKNLGKVTFDNVTFTMNQNVNSTAKALFAGIYNTGTLEIKNSKFVDSYIFTNTESYCFGLIDNNGGTVNIENTIFSDNTIIENSTASTVYFNGLIYNMGTLTLANVNVTNNCMEAQTTTRGLIRGYTNSAITIDNCRFENNTVNSAQNKAYGTAIYAEGGSMTITNSEFIKNTGASSGGAIYSSVASTLINNNFENNAAETGGAIYSSGTNSIYINNTFKGNKAANGGAIYSTVTFQSGKAYNFTGNTFIDNEATTNGGALYVGNSIGSNNYPIENNVFINNKANNRGGAIYSTGTLKITTAIFRGNEASEGAAMYTTKTTASTITYSIFEDNIATSPTGTIIYYHGSSTANNNYWGTNTPDFEKIIAANGGTLTFPTNIVILTIDGNETLYASDNYIIKFEDNVTGDTVDKIPDYTVNLTSNINSITPSSVVINAGEAIFTYDVSTGGQDTIKAISNNNERSVFDVFVDLRASPEFSIAAGDITYGDNLNFTFTLTNGPSGTNIYKWVIYSQNGLELATGYIDSEVKEINCNEIFDAGNYRITVSITDVEGWKDLEVFDTFEIKQKETSLNPIVKINDDNSLTITITIESDGVLVNASGIVSTNIDPANSNVENGQATINTNVLTPNTYEISFTYSGDTNYKGSTNTTTITIKNTVPEDSLNVTVPEGTDSPSFSINLPSDATGNLTVTVDGVNYTQALVNGSATVNVPKLAPGNHNVTVTYSGDEKYSSVSKSTTLEIKEPVIEITKNNDVNMLYTSQSPYKVLITVGGKAVGAGEKVTMKFNGKTYTVETDANGYATLKLPNVKPKKAKYTITAEYKGVKVTNKVKVNSIIKAKNVKVKKSKKVTKIKVTLKKVNGKFLKGKTLKLKIKGKTLKAKTNKKGVATFKVKKNVVKKLKVGKKYTFKVTYGKDTVSKKMTIRK